MDPCNLSFAAAVAVVGSALSVADGDPIPTWVGTLGEELVGLELIGAVELLSCCRGSVRVWAGVSGWLVDWGSGWRSGWVEALLVILAGVWLAERLCSEAGSCSELTGGTRR